LSTTPPRHSAVSSRSWRAIAIVVAVVVVAGGAAFFVFHKPDSSPGHINKSCLSCPITPAPGVDPVRFTVRAGRTVAVVEKSKPDQAEIKKSTQDIRNTLQNMYTVAFIDPEVWKSGQYDNVFGFFAQGRISGAAKKAEETLTLGAKAGDTYSDVKPKSGSLAVKWLTDKGGQPFTAAVTAAFSADATKKDGSSTTVKSHATYIMQRGEGGWIIVAFKAKRLDGAAGATPSKSSGG
jgi:hypothetical protein